MWPPHSPVRVEKLTSDHAAIKARILQKAAQFKTERGYAPPYWELVRLAREGRAVMIARN